MPTLIGFRCDSSIEIGTGHVMRCLALANALREKNAVCVFLCREHKGNLIDLIRDNGHKVLKLPLLIYERQETEKDLKHSQLLGVDWQTDSVDCKAALDSELGDGLLDWMIVDHYALDRRWESSLRDRCKKIMVIDDLADRAHCCDLLLDQSLGRTAIDYQGLAPSMAVQLLGPQYALLRPAFAQLRAESLARRKYPSLKKILVMMGGIDKKNVTVDVLNALENSNLPPEVTVTVVLGEQAPWINQVRLHAARMSIRAVVLSDVKKMAHLMVSTDLAIGAGGTSTWERCTLGIPSITIILATNQEKVAAEMKKAEATIVAGTQKPIDRILGDWLTQANIEENLRAMSHAAAKVTDGLGVMRVVEKMVELNV